jgi:hypothetical protein
MSATRSSSRCHPLPLLPARPPPCRDTRSSLHYDPYCNLLCCAAGTKTVWLLPPGAAGRVAAQPAHRQSANHSPLDVVEPLPGTEHLVTKELLATLQRVELQVRTGGEGGGYCRRVGGHCTTVCVWWWPGGGDVLQIRPWSCRCAARDAACPAAAAAAASALCCLLLEGAGAPGALLPLAALATDSVQRSAPSARRARARAPRGPALAAARRRATRCTSLRAGGTRWTARGTPLR